MVAPEPGGVNPALAIAAASFYSVKDIAESAAPFCRQNGETPKAPSIPEKEIKLLNKNK